MVRDAPYGAPHHDGDRAAYGYALMRPLDCVAVQLGERDERHRPAVIDVGTPDGDLAACRGLLDDLEDTLRAGRADRNHHEPVGLELLQQRRRDVIDAAGDDDLVERGILLPAVIAVRIFGADGLVFGVAL